MIFVDLHFSLAEANCQDKVLWHNKDDFQSFSRAQLMHWAKSRMLEDCCIKASASTCLLLVFLSFCNHTLGSLTRIQIALSSHPFCNSTCSSQLCLLSLLCKYWQQMYLQVHVTECHPTDIFAQTPVSAATADTSCCRAMLEIASHMHG